MVPRAGRASAGARLGRGGLAKPQPAAAAHQLHPADRLQRGADDPGQVPTTAAAGAVVQAGSLPTFAVSAPYACSAGAVDATGSTAAGDTGSAFRWDSTAQQYVYNYHSDKSLAGHCQTITATLDDGTNHSATVAFR